jgi:hypothetical protein
MVFVVLVHPSPITLLPGSMFWSPWVSSVVRLVCCSTLCLWLIMGTGMFGTLFALYFTHRKQRDEEREKRLQYWREQVWQPLVTYGERFLTVLSGQNAFHQNLQQMRETARASILSLPRNGDSGRNTIYDDSNVPILHHPAPKSSGLRHDLADDASFEYDDGLMMKKGDNRF